MRVTTVQVERRKADGAYGNPSMALSAELDQGEDPGQALDALAALVQEYIERAEQRDEEKREAYRQKQLAQYRAQQEEAQRRFREEVPLTAGIGEDLAAEEDDEVDRSVPEM